MRTLVVTATPRSSSLTNAVASTFISELRSRGHQVEVADLVAEKFNPVMGEADEPDWNAPSKLYSAEAQAEMARIERNEATVMVFPVWWWSMPAILKGWIDRVWNNGWAYGGQNFPHRRGWMLAVAGVSRDGYESRGYDLAMRTLLKTGILDYCGIADNRLEVFYGALSSGEAGQEILEKAAALAREF